MTTPVPPIPDGGVLVHIGPYKTGTSTIQRSLSDQREAMREHGVHYPPAKFSRGPGADTHQARASWALIRHSLRNLDPVPIQEWESLVADVAAHPGERVVVSSESLVSANAQHVAQLVADLGPERVHVVMTVRVLADLLPSSWQQRVKGRREPLAYESWLERVLDPARTSREATTFWHHQDVSRLIPLWTRELAPQQVITVVSDPQDRDQQSRVFEGLLGLPAGLLRAGQSQNTSLTYERAELLRQLNILAAEAGWEPKFADRVLHGVTAQALRATPRTGSEGSIPRLPAWARDRVAQLDEERTTLLREAGVRVVGDPDWARSPEGEPGDLTPPDQVPVQAAAHAFVSAVGAVHAAQDRRVAEAREAGRLAGLREARGDGPGAGSASSSPLPRVRRVAGRALRRIGLR